MKSPVFVCFLTMSLSPTSMFGQGSLTPPAGTPAPVFKTLQQIEPRIDLQNAPASAVTTTDATYHYIITQPGSYYLSGNIAASRPGAIQINAAGVTLDLNGFAISRASGTGGNAITVLSTSQNARIFNGVITGFASGIAAATATGCAVSDLAVSNCTSLPFATGSGSVLTRCRVHDNVDATSGISAGAGSVLSDCVAQNNTVKLDAMTAGAGSSLRDCTAMNNTCVNAITGNAGSSLVNCSARNNFNVTVGAASSGINVGEGSSVIGCTATSNVVLNGVAASNTGVGFNIASRCIVLNCTAALNVGDGFVVASSSLVRSCQASGNGNNGDAAGIHVTGNNNRIEDNNVDNNDRGIDVGGTGNLIIKNSASDNGTNYPIVSGNSYGPRINVSGANDISGVSGASFSWANFGY